MVIYLITDEHQTPSDTKVITKEDGLYLQTLVQQAYEKNYPELLGLTAETQIGYNLWSEFIQPVRDDTSNESMEHKFYQLIDFNMTYINLSTAQIENMSNLVDKCNQISEHLEANKSVIERVREVLKLTNARIDGHDKAMNTVDGRISPTDLEQMTKQMEDMKKSYLHSVDQSQLKFDEVLDMIKKNEHEKNKSLKLRQQHMFKRKQAYSELAALAGPGFQVLCRSYLDSIPRQECPQDVYFLVGIEQISFLKKYIDDNVLRLK